MSIRSASAAERGARGFQAFANPEFNRPQTAPIYIYERLAEPSRGMLEEKFASAHSAECSVAFATGMAATHCVISSLLAGEHVVAAQDLYGGTYRLLHKVTDRAGNALVIQPWAADHSAGACRNFSTSPICAAPRYLPCLTTRSTSHQVARWCRRTPSSLITVFDSGKMS